MTIRFAVLAASALLACGCRTPQPPVPAAAASGTRVKSGGESPSLAEAMRRAAQARADYKVSPADLVSVTVYEVLEMSRRVRVNANGEIFLPLVGAVEVGGKTLSAAQSLIEKKLAAYVVKPQVTLFIEEYGNRRFSVMGEVQRPGTYPIPTESHMTVLEAISTAGGFTPVAAHEARVLRFVNGENVTYTIDVRTITRGGQKDKDMIVEPNDVVYVPQSLF